jgi:NDP-sugar pyrophosphorylase family protein
MDVLSGRVGAAVSVPRAAADPGTVHQLGHSAAGAIHPPVALPSVIDVRENTCIGPEVVLGEGCEIAEDVRIVQSVLWPRVRVGRRVTIERSIVTNDVAIPDGSHLVGKIVSAQGITDL